MSWGVCRLMSLIMVAFGACLSGAIHTEPIRWEIGNRLRNLDFVKRPPAASPLLRDAEHDHNNSGIQAAAWFAALAPKPPVDSNDAARYWIRRIITSGGSPYNDGDDEPWNEAKNNFDPDLVKLPKKFTIRVYLSQQDPAIVAAKSKQCVLRFKASSTTTTSIAKSTLCANSGPILLQDIPIQGGTLTVSSDGRVIGAVTILKPALKIILGLGDSYSAGEGSPDTPAAWRGPILSPPTGVVDRVWDFDKYVAKGAHWQSARCNRSFYSWESLLALQEAAKDPHAIVAFVHLACAGAEAVDGLLAPQRSAPGQFRDCKPVEKRRDRGLTVNLHCDVPYSQLRMAVSLLCSGMTLPLDINAEPLVSWRRELSASSLHYARDQGARINDLVRCVGHLRPVYLVVMNEGGNDLGFSGLIANVVFPSGHRNIFGAIIVDYGRKSFHAVCFTGVPCTEGVPAGATSFEDRLKDLPVRYGVLESAFTYLLNVPSTGVLIAQYPDPLTNERGEYCGPPRATSQDNQWRALKWFLRHDTPFIRSTRFQFNITSSEGRAASRNVVAKLDAAVLHNGQGWRVAETEHAFEGHGWCVGRWGPLYPPEYASGWDGLNDVGRYIRTANDSALTQWPPPTRSASTNRIDGLSGTLHPNLQGYAIMSVVAERTLANYQGPTQ